MIKDVDFNMVTLYTVYREDIDHNLHNIRELVAPIMISLI